MGTAATLASLALTYLVLFALERRLPLRRPTASLAHRVAVNAAMSLLSFGTAALLVRPAAHETLASAHAGNFGLVPLLGFAGPAEITMSFLLMDLTFYYWHRANHLLPFLWRMHNVHHIDPDLDVTTAFRFHFIEVALSAAFRVAQLALIGPSLLAFAIYEAAFQTCTLFHHSNLRMPRRLERTLLRILVTPRMHGIHHSDYRNETNSNFGTVFTWWDRLHRTLRLDIPQDRIDIGVPAYSAPEDNRIAHCIALPVLPQRDYWKTASGERIERAP
ncbi:MAG: sterol desaturase family protein [Bacillota bacterium]